MEQARQWLAPTTLAGDIDAARRLARAVDPAGHGLIRREPLPWPCPTDAVDAVVDLLCHKQVPTPGAVESLLNSPAARAGLIARAAWATRAADCTAIIDENRHALGEALSAAVAIHWIDHATGPTWRGAWECEPVLDWWQTRRMSVPPFSPVGRHGLEVLHRAGWVTSNTATGSLCPGRRFYIRFYGDHVSPMPAHVIGSVVARFIGTYRRCHGGRGPSWNEIATNATDPRGVPVFFHAADARAQRRWLLTDGWIRVDRGQLRYGPRAEAEAFRRRQRRGRAGAPLATAS
ncbi:hypothetical protein AB0I30_23165 [Nocardia tengchongensis]|uniref:hypothetical protein n=1 Tax=Nocardia tengchongensis TaxID=2055889 RepID=UPI0033DA430F